MQYKRRQSYFSIKFAYCIIKQNYIHDHIGKIALVLVD